MEKVTEYTVFDKAEELGGEIVAVLLDNSGASGVVCWRHELAEDRYEYVTHRCYIGANGRWIFESGVYHFLGTPMADENPREQALRDFRIRSREL